MWKGERLPTQELTAPLVAGTFKRGLAWLWFAPISSNWQGTPGREKGPFQ